MQQPSKVGVKVDGTWMIIEPFSNDAPDQNHNPIGRIYYSASTMICTPASLPASLP